MTKKYFTERPINNGSVSFDYPQIHINLAGTNPFINISPEYIHVSLINNTTNILTYTINNTITLEYVATDLFIISKYNNIPNDIAQNSSLNDINGELIIKHSIKLCNHSNYPSTIFSGFFLKNGGGNSVIETSVDKIMKCFINKTASTTIHLNADIDKGAPYIPANLKNNIPSMLLFINPIQLNNNIVISNKTVFSNDNKTLYIHRISNNTVTNVMNNIVIKDNLKKETTHVIEGLDTLSKADLTYQILSANKKIKSLEDNDKLLETSAKNLEDNDKLLEKEDDNLQGNILSLESSYASLEKNIQSLGTATGSSSYIECTPIDDTSGEISTNVYTVMGTGEELKELYASNSMNLIAYFFLFVIILCFELWLAPSIFIGLVQKYGISNKNNNPNIDSHNNPNIDSHKHAAIIMNAITAIGFIVFVIIIFIFFLLGYLYKSIQLTITGIMILFIYIIAIIILINNLEKIKNDILTDTIYKKLSDTSRLHNFLGSIPLIVDIPK